MTSKSDQADMLGRRPLDERVFLSEDDGGFAVMIGSGGSLRARRCEMYKPTPTSTLTRAMKAGKSSKKSTISL